MPINSFAEFYHRLTSAGITVDLHEKDVHVPETPEVLEAIADIQPDTFQKNTTKFVSENDGKRYLEIPFYGDRKLPERRFLEGMSSLKASLRGKNAYAVLAERHPGFEFSQAIDEMASAAFDSMNFEDITVDPEKKEALEYQAKALLSSMLVVTILDEDSTAARNLHNVLSTSNVVASYWAEFQPYAKQVTETFEQIVESIAPADLFRVAVGNEAEKKDPTRTPKMDLDRIP